MLLLYMREERGIAEVALATWALEIAWFNGNG
jgi:hypothetical protein